MLAQSFKSAAELKIPEEVHSALLKTLVMLETEAIVAAEFRMDWWSTIDRSCWSGGCIGAWAERVAKIEIDYTVSLALEGLFFPMQVHGPGDPYKATPAQGARALRNYLTTGRASWARVMRGNRA